MMETEVKLSLQSPVELADVWLVQREHLQLIWPQIAAIFEEFDGPHKDFDLSELFISLMQGTEYQLWVGIDAGQVEGFMLTAFVRHAHNSEMHIVAIAGEHLFSKYFEKGLKKLEQYTALLGGSAVVFSGRKEWLKPMLKQGYSRTLQMKKDVRMMWSS